MYVPASYDTTQHKRVLHNTETCSRLLCLLELGEKAGVVSILVPEVKRERERERESQEERWAEGQVLPGLLQTNRHDP